MSLDVDLRSTLLAWDDLSSLIEDRLFSRVAPQGVQAPYVVMLRVSSPVQYHLSGEAGIATPRYQFSCYGKEHGQSRAVAAAIRGCLSGFRGPMGSTRVRWVSIEDVRDLYEDRADGEQIGLFRTDLDLVFAHLE